MDLDEGLGSHVEEFARELDDKKAPSGTGAHPGSGGDHDHGDCDDEDCFEDEYDDVEDDECDA